MATLLEQTRLAHEEVERLERLIVEELSREARTHRERLAQGHRVAAMVDRISGRAAKLVRVHAVGCRVCRSCSGNLCASAALQHALRRG
jgi:hypothetical protein